MPKRPPQANGEVADLYYDEAGNSQPQKFLELVCSVEHGMTGLAEKYGGSITAWKSYIRKAEKESGHKVVFNMGDRYFSFSDIDEPTLYEQMVAEATEMMLSNKAETPPATDQQRESAEIEMERKLSDDDDPEQHPQLGRETLHPSAYEEHLPREFEGGIQGGQAEYPGEGAGGDAWYRYYMQRTDVWETVHEVRLRVVPGKSYAVIHPIGDVHIGDHECDFARVHALVDWVARHDGHYILGMGDYLEAATLGSVRKATIADQVLDLGRAMMITEMLFRQVKDKIICLGEGNHEQAPKRDTGQGPGPLEAICRMLNVPRATYDYPLLVNVGQQRYLIGVHHGTGSARTLGAIWNEVERQLNNNEIQCAIMGHSHFKGAVEQGVQGIVDHPEHGRTWDTKSRHMVRSGSFKKYLPGSFARGKNMKPAVRGTVAIRLYATHDDIHYRV